MEVEVVMQKRDGEETPGTHNVEPDNGASITNSQPLVPSAEGALREQETIEGNTLPKHTPP